MLTDVDAWVPSGDGMIWRSVLEPAGAASVAEPVIIAAAMAWCPWVLIKVNGRWQVEAGKEVYLTLEQLAFVLFKVSSQVAALCFDALVSTQPVKQCRSAA